MLRPMPLLLAQLESLATWMVHPGLFVAGAAAVSLPIIIHLLNKRKFKIVDWAAMEFLLDADKKNRRRVRLENLILLLLRCLAVLLIAFLLARPFLPTSVTAGLIDAAQFERIVLLDDSLSMQARQGNESAWEVARKRLLDLTNGLAQDTADNSLTLILTSQPAQRLFNSAHLSPDSIAEINAEIERREAGDRPANLGLALQELESYIAAQPGNINRVVYLLTDLRHRDWKEGDTNPEAPVKALANLSKLVQGCFVIDVGDDDDRNLTLTEIRPEGMLVQGVTSRFDVAIKNSGRTDVQDVRVKFSAGDALPVESVIDRLPAGESAAVRFNFTFSGDEESPDDASRSLAPRQVKVELATSQPGQDDRLLADSVAFFPARLVRGLPALIIDGDPSADFGKAESFYLRRALAPQGPVPSGVAADIITENELEAADLSKYQVIFLCNNYRLGDKTAEAVDRLEKWVAAGGGLVLLPGDQIDEQFFNDQYFRDGAGLSPLRLENIRGDESEKTWTSLKIENASHEVLQDFADENSFLLDSVKIFRWWGATVKKEQLGKEVSVAARFSDVDDSPAIAEKSFGKGRVLAFTIPADADWHSWTGDPSFLILTQQLVRYLSSDRGDAGLLQVGEPIRQPVDLAQYEPDVTLVGPRELKASLRAQAPAQPLPPSTTESTQQAVWEATYPAADVQGFYELKLTRRDNEADALLFAANIDPTEGNLQRADRDAMQRDLAGTNVQIISALAAQSLADVGTQTEIWWYLLWGVVGVLSVEQLLGWLFGRGRG